MPLTCELGWHRADPLARWNDGYYFSKCTRCGRDLVRTAYQRWHVPKGCKIVWQASPPESRRSATLLPADASPAAPSPAEELPIQEVLRHLETRDLSNDGGVGCEDQEQPPPPPTALEEVHLRRVRVAEVRVDQLLVSDVIRPAPEKQGQDEEADPELPLGGASFNREEDAALEAAPPAEQAELPGTEMSSSGAEEDTTVEAASPVDELVPPGVAESSSEAEEDTAVAFTAPVEDAEPEQNEVPSLPPQEPARRLVVDDFMTDSSDTDFWEVAARPPEPKPEPRINLDHLEGEDALPGATVSDMPLVETVAEDDDYEDTPRFQELDERVDSIAPLDEEAQPELHRKGEKAGSFLSVFTRRRPSSGDEEQPQQEETGRRLSVSGQLAVASLAAAAVLMFASLVARPSSNASPATDRPAAAPAPVQVAATEPRPRLAAPAPSLPPAPKAELFPARQKAFVTARILNCRASPVEQAGSVKKLSRGAEVEILAREAEWMSISHGGRQCWVAVRYISPDRPA
jgi:hypothetical protein